MRKLKVQLHSDLLGVVDAAVLRLSDVTRPEDGGDQLFAHLETEAKEIAKRFGHLPIAEVPGIQSARALYRSVRIDPTKHRPSSEALLRRVIKGKGLYRVHPLVDTFNLASLVSLLPVGLYDESKVAGESITIGLGAEGWSYEGIRRGPINVGGRLCVADEIGPFGLPTADSERTSIEGDVPEAIAIFFAPAASAPDQLTRALELGIELSEKYLNSVVREQYYVTSD